MRTDAHPKEVRWRIAAASQAQDVLDRAADHTASKGVIGDVRASKGAAGEVLLRTAKDEDTGLIAVGSIGMIGHKRFMLGNVANRVSHQAPTDVLILRTA